MKAADVAAAAAAARRAVEEAAHGGIPKSSYRQCLVRIPNPEASEVKGREKEYTNLVLKYIAKAKPPDRDVIEAKPLGKEFVKIKPSGEELVEAEPSATTSPASEWSPATSRSVSALSFISLHREQPPATKRFSHNSESIYSIGGL